ncbi:MAG: cysteine-rich KTR domain-containing protein, partial [Lachnospiraceae bacterium]|nr:cysteine-rich KTR domain-containing protein [Lachnospiraceae bacterium]
MTKNREITSLIKNKIIKTEWIFCPVCGNKTCNRIRNLFMYTADYR